MDFVSDFSSFLGAGEEIEAFFTGGSDIDAIESWLTNMFANLFAEIKQLFGQDLTNAAAATAAGVAQTARDFLAVDYVNAQRAGESDAQLWTLLSVDSSGPSLQALSAQASTMTTWAQDYPTMAQQTVSLALTIYSLMVALRRERAKHAPDRQTRAAETANMRTYAGLAVTRIQPLLDSLTQSRLAAITITPTSRTLTLVTGGGAASEHHYYWYVVADSWNSDNTPQPVLTVLLSNGPGSWADVDPQLKEQIGIAQGLYVNLAQGGSKSQMAQWKQQLTNLINTGSTDGAPAPVNYFRRYQDVFAGFNLTPSGGPGFDALLKPVTALGSWLYKGRTTLLSLTRLSLPGVAYVYGLPIGGKTNCMAQFPLGAGGRLSAGATTVPLQAFNPPPVIKAQPQSVVFSPDGRYAYIVSSEPQLGSASIGQYAIAADLTLSPIPVDALTLASVQGEGSMKWGRVAVSPDGRNIFQIVAYASPVGRGNPVLEDSLALFPVSADGSIAHQGMSYVTPSPAAIAVSADGKQVYVTNFDDNMVTHIPLVPNDMYPGSSQFSLNTTTVSCGQPGQHPWWIALTADGQNAYVGNKASLGTPGSVSQYSVAADGTLSPKDPPSIVIEEGVNYLAVHPRGHSAYVLAGNDTVLQYSVAADGTLSPKSPPTVTTDPGPRAIAVSGDGLSAYVTHAFGTVSQYSIATDGTLSAMTPATVAPVQPPPQAESAEWSAQIAVLQLGFR